MTAKEYVTQALESLDENGPRDLAEDGAFLKLRARGHARMSLDAAPVGALYVVLLSLVLLAGAVSSCGSNPAPLTAAQATPLSLTCTDFPSGGTIPRKYGCDGEDVSPPLQWGEPPPGTRSLALVMDDPDAGGFRHWVLYNLPAAARSLPEAVPPDGELPDGTRQGKNGWDKLGYGGPCPPKGTHRYSFRLYALDILLELPAGASLGDLYQAMQGHVLAEGELVGVYTR
jgi:Raf kinase inhibitor-like YbhB/YbcL family protein